jgi:DNA-directed RNA polymerase specialized sigma24 family protein
MTASALSNLSKSGAQGRQGSGRSLQTSSHVLALAHRYHQSAFQITHWILRDEIAAEKITQQVFARVRRRLERGADHASAVFWIYHASLRFACRYYWKSATPIMRRRLMASGQCHQAEFDFLEFVRVLASQPRKIEQHDCELIALRHVLGLSTVQISQLLRMHPYEISNRVTWGLERLKETHLDSVHCSNTPEFAHAATA